MSRNLPERSRKNRWIWGGLVVWGAFALSCATTSRTLMAPPSIAGASFVGSDQCGSCHADKTEFFHTATHYNLDLVSGETGEIGCESCHGPGSTHVSSFGAAGTIVNPRRSPETCFQCHLDKHGEFSLPYSHPVLTGQVSCADCHDPHKGDAVISGGTQLASADETCFKCHEYQRGPFAFEHEAMREGCTACHAQHGSVNAVMLKARNQTLCLQCHYQEQTVDGRIKIGGRDHTVYNSRGTCWSTGCHEAIHGSHVDSTLRY